MGASIFFLFKSYPVSDFYSKSGKHKSKKGGTAKKAAKNAKSPQKARPAHCSRQNCRLAPRGGRGNSAKNTERQSILVQLVKKAIFASLRP